MKLLIVVGWKEFFAPKVIRSKYLESAFCVEKPGTVVPTAKWITNRAGMYYHDFLFDRADWRRRIEVFVRSLYETNLADGTILLVLPTQMALAGGRERFNLKQWRVFVEQIASLPVSTSVELLCLSLSPLTDSILQQFAPEPSPDKNPGSSESLLEVTRNALPSKTIEIRTIHVLDNVAFSTLQTAMNRNYSQNILSVCYREMCRTSVFEPIDDGLEAFMKRLDDAKLVVRPNVKAKEIKRACREGGELYKFFFC